MIPPGPFILRTGVGIGVENKALMSLHVKGVNAEDKEKVRTLQVDPSAVPCGTPVAVSRQAAESECIMTRLSLGTCVLIRLR